MTTVLDKILQIKRQELIDAKKHTELALLQEKVKKLPKCRNFYRTIASPNPRGINVIAEIKRASPSAGLIRDDFDVQELAHTYARAGADAISVLTDKQFFQGRLEYITMVKQAVSLPVLRKDFIIDPYQVYEARAAGADAILLIAEAIKPAELMDLIILAHSLTLTVLLEVHELGSLLQVRSMVGFPKEHYTLLGINNRNLKTMQVDLNNSLRLIEFLEHKNGLVSESGIREPRDVQRLIKAGFSGILIGEILMRSSDIAGQFRRLFGDNDSDGNNNGGNNEDRQR